MTDGVVSNDPVIAPTPTPISVEPRTVPAGEAAEVARQESEAKVAANARDAKEPAKAEDAPAKPRSIKDAIRAAEAKVNAEPTSTPAKPISVAAKDAPATAEVKDAPKDAPKDAQPRAEDGKFTAKATDATPASKADAQVAKVDASVEKAAVTAKTADAVVKEAPKPSHTAEAPPARFSAAAKEKWAEAPDEVRAEVTRAVTELTKGFEKHRAAAERDGSLAEFHDMAGKSGKALKDVVANYVGMENLLRQDTIKGLELICQNAGLSLKDVAAKVLGQTPDAAASQQDATIRELRAELADLRKGLGSLHRERQAATTQTTTEAVTKFAAENPRFEELADDIAFFLKTRTKDLAEAYKLAERLNPAPAPAPQAAAASSAPARTVPTLVSPPPASTAGEKSIAGSPTAGSDPVTKQPSNSIKEAIRRAKAAAG